MQLRHRTHTDAREGGDRTPRVRRTLLGAALVGAPALVLIGDIVTPSVTWAEHEAVITTAVAESGRWQAGALLSLVGFMLFVPAAIAATGLIRRRRPGLALATVTLISIGAMAVVSWTGLIFTYAAARAADPAQIALFVEETESLGGFLVMLPMYFTAPIGLLVLAFGLWRTKAAPVWVPALLLLATLASFGDGAFTTVAWIGLTGAFAGMAWVHLFGEQEVIDLSDESTRSRRDDVVAGTARKHRRRGAAPAPA
jgi:hypothetical protein